MSKNDLDSRVEPVAIIGMGCRFPGGANTPEAFWELLQGGQDVIKDIPATRWNIDDYYDADPNAPGKMYVRKGYFLDEEMDQFDPQFFNLTPREAAALDPQQRLALEVSWEALEHANIAPGTLAGSQTGIFVSSFWDDYSAQRLYADGPEVIDRYATLSNLRSMISGRLAHLLDVHGPNMQIDTTCSGSLTALHLACQSLRNRECNLALTGGVCLSLCPEIMISLSRMGALSADGYCKTFDQQANGFGLGEGCGMVALKRLSTAQADGDDILAVIRGSAINHDGHSRTVTTPNGLAHQMLLRQALQQAAVTPQQVQYVEAHGTGTELGDPIEVFAIAEVYCDEEREAPLALGSVKTNIGHLNAAAGVASLIKVVLSLQQGEIPPTLHQKQANSRIPWQKLALTVPDQMTPWLSNESPRIAGLSAFGMNGSNAHCIVEQAPVVEKKVTKNNNQKWHHHFLPLSAKTSEALQAQVERYRDYLLKHPETCFADICYTAAVARDHFSHRLAVVATSTQEAIETLESIKQLSDTPLYGQVSTRARPKVGFLFTGQGAQYVDMGRELYDTQPGFRATLEYCDKQLKAHLGESLLAVLYPEKQSEKTKNLPDAQSPNEPLINQTRYTQPALFALEYALAKLWQSWDIQPNILIGHSVGELVAACIAGVFSLDDGLKLIAARARLMDELPSGGEMLALLASETLAREVIAAYPDEVSLASINGPENVVISGRGQAIQAIAEALTTRGIKTRRLTVSHAFHSPLMEPMLEKFRRVATTIRYHKATLTLVSNVTGQLAGDEIATADYWVEHVGKAVRFADGIATLHEKGIDIFLEIGPKPTLLGMAGQVAGAKASPGMLPSLREGHSDWQQMLSSVGELYVRGVNINRKKFDEKNSCHKVVLPTYPFQRERYWVEPSSKKRTPALRPLIDTMTRLPLHGEVVFEKIFSVEALPFLADHRVYDTTISPAACQLVMVLSAAELTLDTTSFFQLKNVILPQPLVIPDGKECTVQTVITANEDRTQYGFKLISFDSRTEVPETATHAVGDAVKLINKTQPDTIDLNRLRECCDQVLDISALYNGLALMQIELGPRFRWLAQLWQKPDGSEMLAKLVLPEMLTHASDYLLHPGLLDACFQTAAMIQGQDESILPFSVEALRIYRPVKNTIGWCHSVQTGDHQWNIHLLDEQGRQVIAIEGLEVRVASSKNIQGSEVWRDWLYQVEWQLRTYLPDPGDIVPTTQARAVSSVETLPDIASAVTHLLFADKTGIAEVLASQLRQQGEKPVLVYAAKQYQQIDADTATIRPDCIEDYPRLLAAFPDVHRLVHLWSLDLPNMEDNLDLLAASQQGCGTTLYLVQALLQTTIDVKGLYLVTRDAQGVNDADSVSGVSQSAVWGMAKVITIEHPELNCVCIDLDGHASVQTSAMQLCAEIRSNVLTTQGETQIALRRDARYVARLTRFKSEPKKETISLCQAEATYLVTGGLGGLGLLVAQHLVTQGARHLLLLGRSKAKPEVQLQLDALMATGVSITVAQVDVTRLEQLAEVVSQVDKRYPLRGVIHSVGVLDDGILLQQNRGRFAAVLAPKMQGAGHLHQLTKALPLDFFVLFSSIASLLGNATQANHAAANAFLDAFSGFRQAQGLPSLTINWGAWSEVGAFATLTQVQQQKIFSQGLRGISSSQGIATFNHLQSFFKDQTTKQVGVTPIGWDRFLTHNNRVFASDPFYAHFKADIKSTIEPVKQIDIQQVLVALNDEQRTIRLIRYLQQTIAKIVRVPDPEKIGIRENFTELGLDSLMSIELTTRLATDFSVSLPGTLAFNHPSIEELCHYLINDVLRLEEDETKSEKLSGDSELIRVSRTVDPELSFVQKRIWLHQMTDPEGCFHNLAWSLRFGGALNVDILQQSLNEMVRRHEILRTSFPLVNDVPVQAISSIAVVDMIHHDLSGLTEQAKILQIEQITQQDARKQPFDLATGPLLRATLIKQANDVHILLLCFHHTVIDFRSLVIFAHELCEIYAAFVQGEPSPLKELSVQYADYSAWQHRLFTPKEQQLRINYWTEWWEKGQPPLLELPLDKPRQYSTFRACTLPCQWPENLTRQLKIAAQKENSTPFIMLLSTLSTLLYRYSGCKDIMIGTTFSGRNHPDLESMIGYIGSLIHLRVDLQGNPQLPQLLKQVRNVVQKAIACQDVPYQQIAEYSPDKLNRNMTPFRVMLTFVPEVMSDTFDAAGLDVSIIQTTELENRPDLVVMLVMSENKPGQPTLKGFWRYRKDLFEEKTILKMAENFQCMLESMVNNQGQTIDDLPLKHLPPKVKKNVKKSVKKQKKGKINID